MTRFILEYLHSRSLLEVSEKLCAEIVPSSTLQLGKEFTYTKCRNDEQGNLGKINNIIKLNEEFAIFSTINGNTYKLTYIIDKKGELNNGERETG